ncbi:MAG: carboxypeptidase-like regulatory domain-containing protein, partial [Bacteroidota bacterium]
MLVFFLSVELFFQIALHGQSPSSSRPDNRHPSDTTQTRTPLLDVLIALNKTKGVYFLFSQPSLGKMLVNTPVLSSNLPIEKILGQVLKNTGLHFKKVDEHTFVILNKKPLDKNKEYDPYAGVQDPSETATDDRPSLTIDHIKGRVMARDGKALPGVSVTVRGTRKGVSTDLGGVFDIQAKKEDTLSFSFVGYKPEEVTALQATKTIIFLQPSDQPLTEVLVTAMGIQKQERSLGYSAAQLDGSGFTLSRDVNLGNALVGQVAGLSVAENATGPYGSSRVLIRGNASLSGNNQPLYVIDGVPYDNTTQSYAGQYGGADLGDGLSNISPDNIESILVLKGVAASSLYGYRGGNGAILITTKSGSRTRGIGVQVNNNFTINSIVDQRDFQYTYGQGVSGVKPTSAQTALAAPYYSWGSRLDGSNAVNYLGDSYAYRPAKDNFRHFFQTGLTNQSSVGLTGANTKGHFRLGLSDLYLQSPVPNSFMP